MLFLFGIIQYGYGLFQYQAFTSALNDATRKAATGIESCDWLDKTVSGFIDGNGLDAADLSDVKVRWLQTDASGGVIPADTPLRLGQVQLTATYRPVDLGIPFLPFPDEFHGSRQSLLQDVINVDLGSACQVLGP